MVRSVIPDSDDDSGEEISRYNFASTIPPTGVHQQSPSLQTAVTNRDNANAVPATTPNDADAQLILGTGLTDSAVFQQIYDQNQASTDATLHAPVSQLHNQEQISSTSLHHILPVIGTSRVAQLPTLPQQELESFSTVSSSATIKKLKRSKTNIQHSSFTSPEAPKNQQKMKRANSMKSYPHTIEGSSQDVTVNVADTGDYTKLSQNTFTYRKIQNEKQMLSPEVAGNMGKDVYDFPGSSDGLGMNMRQITKKAGSKTTMDLQKEKKTYGKVRRTKTMVPPSSLPDGPLDDAKRQDDVGHGMHLNAARSPTPAPVQEQAPRRSLAQNIQRKKEEKVAAERKQASAGAIELGEVVATEAVPKAKTPVKTYAKIKRSKTGVLSGSPSAAGFDSRKRSADDSQLADKHKRKSDAQSNEEEPFELPTAKRFQKSKNAAENPTSSAMKQAGSREVVVLSSSQDDPVDLVADTVITPTASMPEPLLKSSSNTVLVPGTKSQMESSASNLRKTKDTAELDSNTSVVVDSNVSVVKATKSSGNKSSDSRPSSTSHAHPETPKLPCFNSSQEHVEAVRSVLKKVDEMVNSPAPAPADASHPKTKTDTSSPLIVSFDKGLVGKSIVLVPELTDSQKDQYIAVSVTGSEGDGKEQATRLAHVISPANIEKWSGASSTVANSTWRERDSGDKRAPTMEPLSSQPRPSSRRVIKRSKTGLEQPTPTRRGRSASVHSDTPPSSGSSDVVVSSSRKIARRKTMASGDEPLKSSPQLRRTHVVKTVTTYEKLKDPDASAPSFPEVAPSSEVSMPNTQGESVRGTKRKSGVADLDVALEHPKSQGKTQEELDFDMAKRLQAEMDKDEAEPETRAKWRAPSKPEVVEPNPEPLGSQDAGLPPPEMYKPRLSSRRSKSLSAKADTNAVETFIDGLPRPKKGKGKKPMKETVTPASERPKVADKENVEPPNEPTEDTSVEPISADVLMEEAPAPLDDNEEIIVATEVPKSLFNKDEPAKENITAGKLYPVPKNMARAPSKPAVIASVQEELYEDVVAAPKKRGRAAKAVVQDTDDSVDELSVMGLDVETPIPKAPVRGRAAAQKRSVSNAAASKPAPKSKEIVDTDDDDDVDEEELPVKPATRSSRSKQADRQAPAKQAAKSKEIVDTDDDEDEEEPVTPASPVKALAQAPAAVAPTPVAKARGVTRKSSTPGFKAPTMTRNKSISVDTDVPQTPRREKPPGSQELTPKSTPPGAVSHSPLRGGVVPLRVGLSRKTRLPSLLKIIRK